MLIDSIEFFFFAFIIKAHFHALLNDICSVYFFSDPEWVSFLVVPREQMLLLLFPPPTQDSVPWKRRALLLILSPERKRKAFLSEMASLVIKGHSTRRPQTVHVVSLCGSGERETQCSQCSPPWQFLPGPTPLFPDIRTYVLREEILGYRLSNRHQ